jgi:hypothetical protein
VRASTPPGAKNGSRDAFLVLGAGRDGGAADEG